MIYCLSLCFVSSQEKCRVYIIIDEANHINNMAALELNHLTEAERDLILSVVRRDEELQKKELARIE